MCITNNVNTVCYFLICVKNIKKYTMGTNLMLDSYFLAKFLQAYTFL